jgi:hypothetical protein
MAEKSIISANIAPYGLAIGNALSKSAVPMDELIALRDRARELIGVQGDLVAAVKALDAEIASRGATKSAPPPADERFVVQLEGLALPDSAKAEIEHSLQTAVMAEIAKIDTGGDMVATPLSKAKLLPAISGSPFPGGITMGLVACPPVQAR